MLLLLIGVGMYSCKKYVDKPAVADPRLTRHYCNDPLAVNYNWDFPGVPDNTICFYPTDLFAGVYELHDSVFFRETGFFVSADTIEMTIVRNSTTQMTLVGMCSGGQTLLLTSNMAYMATLDTTLGKDDSTVINKGQGLCGISDTVNGTIVSDKINDSILYINFMVYSDTGVVTNHLGTAKLKHR